MFNVVSETSSVNKGNLKKKKNYKVNKNGVSFLPFVLFYWIVWWISSSTNKIEKWQSCERQQFWLLPVPP